MTARMLALLVLIGSLSTSVWAQGGACTQYKTWWVSAGAGTDSEPVYWPSSGAATDMELLQAQYGGVGPTCSSVWEGVQGVWGGWSGECHSVGWTCAPASPPVGVCPTCNVAGAPINLVDGDTYIQQTDVRIPGLGNGLNLTRVWNSIASQGGIFGPGWTSTYEEQLVLGGDGTMKYTRADGSVWSFAFYGNPPTFQLIAPGNGQATLTEQGNASWTVNFQNGEKRVFTVNPTFLDQYNHYQDNNGRLVTIIDRNGNATTLTYNTLNNNGNVLYTTLATVTSPGGRHLYFAYGTGATSNLVTSVTSDTGSGISLTYTYSPSILTRVTQADNSFVTFTYDAFNNVTSVKDANGKVLESHTYDLANRGLSSSRSNGVDALTVAYPTSP
jgi:YD repeat-containing protein